MLCLVCYLSSYLVRSSVASLLSCEETKTYFARRRIFRVASFAIRGALNLDKARVNRQGTVQKSDHSDQQKDNEKLIEKKKRINKARSPLQCILILGRSHI